MKKNVFHLLRQHGILQHEMFAVKNMDVNSNLLKLKLDMVYRDLDMEEAQKRFSEITTVVPPPSEEKPEITEVKVGKQKKPTRRTVKGLLPSN